MATRSPQSITDGSHSEHCDERDALLWEQLAEKLVRFGQQVILRQPLPPETHASETAWFA